MPGTARMDYRELPKVELHHHLEACFRPQTIREIGTVLGVAGGVA